MERNMRTLLEIVIILVFLSIGLTYMRAVMLKDFYVVEGDTAGAEFLE